DLTRFNQALDQTLAESITRYTREIEYSQELFVAVLGHDLRTPLSAITLSSQALLEAETLGAEDRAATERIGRSAERMNLMIGDLLDFTRSRLGSGIPIDRQDIDLASIAAHAVQEARAAWPGCEIELQTSGELHGHWDGARISQVLSNLLSNAAQHGAEGATICVTVAGAADYVELRVQNFGPPIPVQTLAGLFSPFKRLRHQPLTSDAVNLGLGLYIVEQIVVAHGGAVTVESNEEHGTAFVVQLPR
ncbi:MAG: HAMP domain-containing sensor histidine kinase, partial [Gemmatimonadaceae bacterium]